VITSGYTLAAGRLEFQPATRRLRVPKEDISDISESDESQSIGQRNRFYLLSTVRSISQFAKQPMSQPELLSWNDNAGTSHSSWLGEYNITTTMIAMGLSPLHCFRPKGEDVALITSEVSVIAFSFRCLSNFRSRKPKINGRGDSLP
jgi:hypothetical protein